MKTTEILKICDKYASRLPKQAVADVESNHFELSGNINGEYKQAWLNLSELLRNNEGKVDCNTEYAKDIGAVLEMLAIAPEMEAKLREIAKILPEMNEMLYNLGQLDLEAEYSEEVGALFMKLHHWENT